MAEQKEGIVEKSPATTDSIKKLINESSPFYAKLKERNSHDSYTITYDAPTAQLESIYFWILDFIQDMGIKTEKLTDNFTSSFGSGHFAEMGQRATRMQEEGMKILGAINQVIKSILNLIYDLKEFEIRLGHYEDAKDKDEKKKKAGFLSLKQIWMDNVDIKKGRGSINQMSFELGFSTLRDAFMICDSIEDIQKNQVINDQIKRILIPRLSEFLKWKEYSEDELRKRFTIEKSYLKSQVETLKLYSSWVRPYLKAAEALKMQGFDKNPALVNAFNTTMFELVLFGKSKFNFKEAVMSKKLPAFYINKKLNREYFSCVLISLTFRGFPQKVTQQHYGFGGRVDIKFDCYALNEEEISLFKKNLEDKDVETSLTFAQESTDKSLRELKDDIEHFLGDKNEGDKTDGGKSENINPFTVLFGLFKSSKKDEKPKKPGDIKDIKKDDIIEKAVRAIALSGAREKLYAIYDVYKKAHAMASSPDSFDKKERFI